MNFRKQPLQLRLKFLVLRSLVKLAKEVSAGPKGVEGERKSGHTQILNASKRLGWDES